MARFRATIEGQRGQASRLGSKTSGLFVTANGWDRGVSVVVRVDTDGLDHFYVYKTGGSGNAGGRELIAEFI